MDNSDPATFPAQGNELLPLERPKMLEDGGWGAEPHQGSYLAHGGQLSFLEEEQDRFENCVLLLCEGELRERWLRGMSFHEGLEISCLFEKVLRCRKVERTPVRFE